MLFRDWLLLIGSRFALTPKLIQDNELKNETCDCKKMDKANESTLTVCKIGKKKIRIEKKE